MSDANSLKQNKRLMCLYKPRKSSIMCYHFSGGTKLVNSLGSVKHTKTI